MTVTIEVDGTDYDVPSSAADTNWAAQQVAFEQAIVAYLDDVADDLETLTARFTPSFTSLSSLLVNSWVQVGGTEQVAGYWKDPSGFVHLRGQISDGASGTTAFTLPTGYRPSKTVRFVVNAGTAPAYVSITSAGVVAPINVGTSDVNAWVSFDQVSFSTAT